MEGSESSLPLRVVAPSKRTPAEALTLASKRGSTTLSMAASSGAASARARLLRSIATRRLGHEARPLRLCLGSGHAPIPGWVNIDFEPPADVLLDLRYGLPVDDGAVTAIYSEHLVEHLTLEAGLASFREWHRVLAPDGVVRVATPDLEQLIASYGAPDWRGDHEWLTWPEYQDIDSPVRMINMALRAWGHLYLFDFDELAARLGEAGFTNVKRVAIGESDEPALRLLETRADSRLVVEARK